MAFKIVKQPRAWWPVEFPGVAEDGSIVTNKFEVQFNLLKVDAAAEWMMEMLSVAQGETKNIGRDGKLLPDIYAGQVARVANNWRGIEAENGDPLAYDGDKWLEAIAEADAARSAAEAIADADARIAALAKVPDVPTPIGGGANLRLLMNEPGMFTHVFNAFRACQAAKAETRAGN